MPKFKATIREQPGQKNKDGEYNIKIRITHQGKTRYIGTDYYVAPDQIVIISGKLYMPFRSKLYSPNRD
jgi:hypothetical protein